MTAVLLAIGAMVLYGVPATLMLDPRARGAKLAGLAFLYGSGISFFAMLLLAIVHAPWNLATIAITSFALAALFRLLRVDGRETLAPAPATRGWAPLAVHALTCVALAAYTRYVTYAPVWEWDFWAIWGLKARVFFEHGGIDWRFLESPFNAFAHPDYPLLVTLNDAFVAIAGNGWNDRWMALLNVAFAVAALCVVYAIARRETTPLIAALATFACASTAMSRYVGLAEGALIAFGGAGVLMARAAIRDDDHLAMRHAALLLGFAASCKNEGVALLGAVIVGLAFVARRRIVELWPAAVIVAPWMILRAMHRLATDLATGPMHERVLAHLRELGPILRDLAVTLVNPAMWIALIAAFAIAPAALRRRERFVLIVAAIQLAAYLGSYLVTPNDVHWHIATSWTRLTRQPLIPLIVAAVTMLANWAGGGQDAPHAEARSEL